MPEHVRTTTVEIPWRTIFKVIAAAALIWVWFQIAEVVLVLIVAVLIAVVLDPIVCWLARRGVSRGVASTIVSLAIVLLTVGFTWLTWHSLTDQAAYFSKHLAEVEQQVVDRLPPWIPGLAGGADDVKAMLGPFALRVARSAVSAVVIALLGFVLTIYLLSDGPRVRAWLMAFVPPRHRARMTRTLDESHAVVFGYVAGNVITSVLAGVFVFTLLTVLNVPAALLLALIAALADFVPVIGFICSALPAVLLAASVSTTTALIVFALYGAYHMIENYVLSPWAYGGRLKVASITVILALAIGAELAGVIGALIALPLAALYPAIERIWLRDELPDETVREHRALERHTA